MTRNISKAPKDAASEMLIVYIRMLSAFCVVFIVFIVFVSLQLFLRWKELNQIKYLRASFFF